MPNKYFIYHPRNFSNEYDVFVVTNKKDAERLQKVIPEVERITRQKAIKWGWSRPRDAKKTGEQWFGGFAESYSVNYIENVEDAIREAIKGTLERIEEKEDRQKYPY